MVESPKKGGNNASAFRGKNAPRTSVQHKSGGVVMEANEHEEQSPDGKNRRPRASVAMKNNPRGSIAQGKNTTSPDPRRPSTRVNH